MGEKLELTATARDSKGAPIPTSPSSARSSAKGPTPATEPVELYSQGDEARATQYATEHLGQPANYTATVIARRDGKEIGHDSARFLVYQDDRELENPSADLKLAREIAELTGGELVTPEKLMTHLKGIDRSAYTEYVSHSEYKVWDNWPVPPDLRRHAHARMVAAQAPRLGLSRCGEKRLRSALRAGVWAFSRRSYGPELTNVESDCVCHRDWGRSHMDVLNEASGPSRSTDSAQADSPPSRPARLAPCNDATGRVRPISAEEQARNAQAIADLVERMLAMPDDDPPGAWEEAMRDLDAHRPHRKLFEGLY